ncbi:molecular chaperone DnaK [Paractinoplanes tereljensis]|uniref:Molecular chaperone DnaK n=1 Tax=Paractinoplanes tereljensis TaxID=571912 RepID=A0A919NXF5_9ACTN|nr:molecular chaperone DnaK [Actinoplanes tereljensis]
MHFESPHRVMVGTQAKDAAKGDASRVVSLIKRHMGSTDTVLEFDGVSYSPEGVSAFIVRELARSAEKFTGQPVSDVVITVPAYFGISERKATEVAGKIAGLTVVGVVAEPVAAALYYGALAGGDRTILVYDLGGGTFDTTVIRLEGGDVTVICTDGDHQLGGADWDERVATHLRDRFVAEYPEAGAADSEDFLQSLGLIAEGTKKALSVRTSRRQPIQFEGKKMLADLSRATFEELTTDLIDRTVEITRRTLRTAEEMGARRPETVLLVGGSTLMPAVATALRAAFGFEPRLHDPHLAVAKGAALYAMQVATEKPSRKVTIVVPRAFGTSVVAEGTQPEEGKLEISHLLFANTPLPAGPVKERFITAFPDQTGIEIDVWEQAGTEVSRRPEDNKKIGAGEIIRLPRLPKGSPIDITFAMDETGLLTVDAVELVTGQRERIEVQIGGLDDRQIDEAREAVARLS